jgi:glutaredoxin
MEKLQKPDCPHCEKSEGTYFDRSFSLDSEGNEIPEETYPYRCNACDKNVDAPKEYYE